MPWALLLDLSFLEEALSLFLEISLYFWPECFESGVHD